MLKTSTERTAPVLSRELKDSCNLAVTAGVAGGYFDGPLAYKIVCKRTARDGKRTESDKDFYRLAERLQREKHLPDGCMATEYHKKALAFVTHIRPYLAQAYDDEDTSQYLIALMPKALRGEGRRIKDKLE